ncbi:YdcF family protein [Caedibacter taeniospiralis]|jgi:uncharacterized SAM-binding protein YcdF (DUF218 family)|uniref:YdcF family protein n=1 Tax=Caedibacter taeniospiralis TaxID=28907 RepID=UPI0037C16036
MFWLIDSLYSIVAGLLHPLVLSFIFLLIVIFLKKQLRIKSLVVIALLILYLSSTGFVASYFLSGLEKYKQVTKDVIDSHGAVILLGAGLEKGSSIQPTLLAYSRILEAYRIYSVAKKNGIHYKIIVTGGDVRKYGISEAEVYSRTLEEMGVDKSDLLLEKSSLNTYQNAEYTKEIIKNLPYNEYLLVTSSIHMKRSLLYFEHFKINVTPAISDNPQPIMSWVPSSYNLTLLSLAIHEYQSILRLYTYDYFNINNKAKENIFSKEGQ